MGNYHERQVLYLEKVDSELFDKVIVVLKKNPKVRQQTQRDLVKEAERIIQEYIETQYCNLKPMNTKNKKKINIFDILLNVALFLSTLVFLYFLSKIIN